VSKATATADSAIAAAVSTPNHDIDQADAAVTTAYGYAARGIPRRELRAAAHATKPRPPHLLNNADGG
jgi:hypothetical protein